MGFLDKVKDFLDDGKINGSTQQPQQAQQTQPVQPAQPENDSVASAEENVRHFNELKAQAGVDTNAAANSENDRTIEAGETVTVEVGFDSPVAYADKDMVPVRFTLKGTVVVEVVDYTQKYSKLQELLNTYIKGEVFSRIPAKRPKANELGAIAKEAESSLQYVSNYISCLKYKGASIQIVGREVPGEQPML
ncbi:MAG: hypothetical protein J5956_12155 [Ruminococcus sp.]|nr:hypothetical protein [Ruminococcus sp.]